MIVLPNRIALFSDAHGHTELIEQALKICAREKVEEIMLLGDLIDRDDQADDCVAALQGWRVRGVYGNHEQELMDALTMGADLGLRRDTIDFFMNLQEHFIVDDVCFCHDGPPELNRDEIDHFINRASSKESSPYHIVFSGHTHFRHARNEFGPLDFSGGLLKLRPDRRYSINPGALTMGNFAVWERDTRLLRFFTAHRP